MKIAITEWNGRIAPVFDVADQAIVFEENRDGLVQAAQIVLPDGELRDKILFLQKHNIRQLICGAISCHARMAAEAAGIKVHGFIAGDYREVIEAWRQDRLSMNQYTMPGCGPQKKCCRRRRRNHSPDRFE